MLEYINDLYAMKIKINLMNGNVLNNLQERNNTLKSKLLHEQIRHDNYSFNHLQKCFSIILNEYCKNKSLYLASLNEGFDHNNVINWYVQGQLGNPMFKDFSASIDRINENFTENDNLDIETDEFQDVIVDEFCDGDYEISQYGDGWSYKTFRDGEKIFIISNDLETLKNKIRNQHLPLD